MTPAGSTSVYEEKAALTAADATSSLRTALLAARTYEDGDLYHPYLEVMLVEAENALGSVSSTFDSIEPPDTDRADRLRADLGALLDASTSGVTDLRIAARRDEPETVARTVRQLADTARELDTFSREHSS